MFARLVMKSLTASLLALVVSLPALAQAPAANPSIIPYGPPVSVEVAKRVAAAGLAETRKNNWNMAVAIVDPSGNLVYYEKMDNTQLASAKIAVNKARSAALFKRPTKAFQDALAGGGIGLRVLGLEGAVPVEGGFPPGSGRKDHRGDWHVGGHERTRCPMRQGWRGCTERALVIAGWIGSSEVADQKRRCRFCRGAQPSRVGNRQPSV